MGWALQEPHSPSGMDHINQKVLKPYFLVSGDGISVASQKMESNSYTKQDCTTYPSVDKGIANFQEDRDTLHRVQRNATKLIRVLENKLYDIKLKEP
ncbi:hypothetical protein BTVI_28025 [Pitangus sulphuratus]|nr:hypothetical protein BTVI_28025 [Pitangus sulphuratus]